MIRSTMKHRLHTAVALAASLAFTSGAAKAAHQPTTASPASATASAPTAAIANPLDFLNASIRILAAANAGNVGPLWDAASPLMKSTVARDKFVEVIQHDQAANGPLRAVDWRGIGRVIQPQAQGSVPAGEYVSVTLVTISTTGKPATETISFVLDTDHNWRLAGLTQR